MPDRYFAERGIPTVPTCARSTISLEFNGRMLVMSGAQVHSYPGASGQPDGTRGFDYSPARQRQRNVGPIPVGQYWIQPSQIWTNRWYSLASRSSWGNHRLTIHVMPGTQTHDRGGFFIHGGSYYGSAGCINLRAGMDDFVRDLDAVTKAAPNCYIPVAVRY